MNMIENTPSGEGAKQVKCRRTKQDWKALVEAWEASSQTQVAFCQERNLCYRLFNQWKNRFKQEKSEPSDEVAHFVPVQIKSTASEISRPGIQVHLPNGIRLEMGGEGDLPLLVASAKALLVLSC